MAARYWCWVCLLLLGLLTGCAAGRAQPPVVEPTFSLHRAEPALPPQAMAPGRDP